MAPSPSLLPADQSPNLIVQSTTPPNSASSSSTPATPPHDKRTTRDQPNLSDCHCCNSHVNHTNPKDRLRPLKSFWRIVLLCRKCRKKVSSGQTCTYCFGNTENDDGKVVTCGSCERRIHKDCVRDYGSCAPWCYVGAGVGEFRTCLDCWVPDSLKSSISGGRRRSESKCGAGEDSDGLEKVLKNAKFQVEKKVKMAAKAKEQELRKVMAAKKAVYLANGALILASKAKKRRDGEKGGSSSSSNAVGVADDAELAAQFRRIFNCSLKISRKEFCLDPSDLRVWKVRNWGGITYKRSTWRKGSGEKIISSGVENDRVEENGSSSDVHGLTRVLTYKRDKKRKVWKVDDVDLMVVGSSSIQQEEKLETHSGGTGKNCSIDVSDPLLCVDANESGFGMDTDQCISEDLVCVNPEQRSSCIDVDRFGRKLTIYKRSKFRRKGEANGMVCVPGECHVCSDQGVTCNPEHLHQDREMHRASYLVKYEAEQISPNGCSNSNQDRYYLKYSKRVGTAKSYHSLCSDHDQCEKQTSESALNNSGTDSSLKSDHDLRLSNENRDVGLDHRYCIKYVKRVKGSKSGSNSETKLHSHSIQHENGASSSGLVGHHTAESRTMSSCS